ncbi:FxSxx-COOH system tetratricopeptide repeat protein [Actinoplanes sp. KI2]|uniref:FxSxx-COOH system tetratricopeptide repeat protein n=1 Tax=Actinoplanes sp. KI2 TaxID=2983315 RepID=UPI0021D5BECE|nr:FxSxx-COOH system tetratricopeptide repeat protein [Actinoplanes sp. KI2]MCU7724971.1 FxSxx-COOH system tetratricopeptide repeat protein [Actinoplanes sp. KI2]
MADPNARLLDVLLQVPGLEDRVTRDDRVAELSEALTRDLVFPRSDDARDDMSALLDTLAEAPADLRGFGEIILRRHPGAAATRFAELTISARSTASRPHDYRPEERIVGDIPIRNRNFTGRVELLERLGSALDQGTTTSVLPPSLNGMGGVGKTQLVTEYVHRHLDQYDLIWWITAEETSTVLAALTQLAQRLDLPIADDQQKTARTVLNWLAGSDREWLLVYDNADQPWNLTPLLPSTGGHVIVTTRNEEWERVGVTLEVDVFRREESIQLLIKRTNDHPDRGTRVTEAEADELAEMLGDLPLALEQAAAWLLATDMPVGEYIELLEVRRLDLLGEGRPPGYPLTVATMVAGAIEKLRMQDEAIVQLFALFAFLGGDGIRQSLLRRGSNADLSPELKAALSNPIRTGQLVRELRRYGLAKTVSRSPSSALRSSADRSPRIQVHRLVQRVLRDTLSPQQRAQTLHNVQNLLAAGSPGDPEEIGELDLQSEMGPHLTAADMIHARTAQGRQTILDHARYLYLTGDYEGSRLLSERAAAAWTAADPDEEQLGPDGLATLLARAQVASATRAVGDVRLAARIFQDTYQRFLASDQLGPDHEYTLITGNQRGHDLRIEGRYREALAFDQQSVQAHRQVFGDGDSYTLRTMANLAVDHRLIGEFAAAARLDDEIASHYADVGVIDIQVVWMNINVARDYYGLGHYGAALERLEEWLPLLERLVGPRHPYYLLSERMRAITLRKLGRLHDARELMTDTRERTVRRFNVTHEYAMVANMSLANVLRQLGELDEAALLINDALTLYRKECGPDHPLTLAAEVNQAILLRASGDFEQAFTLDVSAQRRLEEQLGAQHPDTVCAGTSLATDHALAGRASQALALSERMLQLSKLTDVEGVDVRGGSAHPYVLMRAVNLAHDLRATGDDDRAAELFDEAIIQLTAQFGADHPEVSQAVAGRRLEGDIEPPPT